MLPNTIIVLLLTLMVQFLNAGGTVDIYLGDYSGNWCRKYTEEGLKYLALTHVRILEVKNKELESGGFEFINNVVCKLTSRMEVSPYTHRFDCDGKKSNRTEDTDTRSYIIIGVKAIKPMLSGPIEYMYSEDMMKLFEMGFLDPTKMKNEKFHHDRHLQIQEVWLYGVYHKYSRGYICTCHYTNRCLIADHGLYRVIQQDHKRDGWWGSVVPIYYEPLEKEGVIEVGNKNYYNEEY